MKCRRISERRIYELLGISRTGQRYTAKPKPQDHLAERIKVLSAEYPRYGQNRVWALLRRSGVVVNLKAVARLWQKLGLQVTRRPKRRKVRTGDSVPQKAEFINHVWTYDFVFDWSFNGVSLKFLTLEDEFTRESLAIEVGHRFRSQQVQAVLARVFQERGVPRFLRSDNGSKFIATDLQRWIKGLGRLRPLFLETERRATLGENPCNLDPMLGSFIHMSVNRLLGAAQREQEGVVYHFLARWYQSKLARARRTAQGSACGW